MSQSPDPLNRRAVTAPSLVDFEIPANEVYRGHEHPVAFHRCALGPSAFLIVYRPFSMPLPGTSGTLGKQECSPSVASIGGKSRMALRSKIMPKADDLEKPAHEVISQRRRPELPDDRESEI
jgi:hypothetical protein